MWVLVPDISLAVSRTPESLPLVRIPAGIELRQLGLIPLAMR